MLKVKTIVFICLLFLYSSALHGQTVQRSIYGVFSSVTFNDSLLLAGGQILTGKSLSPLIEHGYYPLNGSFLSIDQTEGFWHFSLYPNPTQSLIMVERSDEVNDLLVLQIYTVDGKIIRTYTMNTGRLQLDLSDLSAGMYQLIISDDGEKVFMQKFVKVD
jgi:hypothetical protein